MPTDREREKLVEEMLGEFGSALPIRGSPEFHAAARDGMSAALAVAEAAFARREDVQPELLPITERVCTVEEFEAAIRADERERCADEMRALAQAWREAPFGDSREAGALMGGANALDKQAAAIRAREDR